MEDAGVEIMGRDGQLQNPEVNMWYLINIDYFIESVTYGFLFTSCKTLENERVSAANE